MPTKRRIVLFVIVLALMLLAKHAFAQETRGVEWRGPNATDSEAIEHAVYVTMAGGVIFGLLAGGGRAVANRRRTKKEGYFTGDLTMMSLREPDRTDNPETKL
jgi:hypothetical protein